MSDNDVNFHPDEWVYHTKGTVIAGDDLGAYTFTARDDGWYYLHSKGIGNGFDCSYMPPGFKPHE